jgi:hypothetical protein
MNYVKRFFSLASEPKFFVPIFCVLFFLAIPLVASAVGMPLQTPTSNVPQSVDWMDQIFLFMANVVLFCVNLLGKLIVLLTEIVLVNVMVYNNYGSSAVIGAGWAVVRDMMNMGFVIVLLIVAMVTIFGGKVGSWKVEWQKSLVNLFLFAILINFSRTICVFLIDIGQVFMMTFANAIKDIAGGNFLQLFGLSDFLGFDSTAIAILIEQNKGISAFNLLTAVSLALIMSIVVFGTILILTVVLVYRIVMLWVLVVLSPLAFFFGGADVLRKAAGDPYADWWKKFSSTVAVGPVLVFFLWLTLSVAGSGNIAATEGFPTGASPDALGEFGNATGFITKIANPGRLLSFIISMGMLYAGFEAASKFSNALPGMASRLVKGGVSGALKLGAVPTVGAALMAGKLAGKTAVATTKGGMWLGGKGIQFAGKTEAGQQLREGLGKELIKLGGGTGLGWLTRIGTSLEQSRRQESAGRLKENVDAVANYNKEETDAELALDVYTPGGVMKQQALRYKVLTNAFLRRKYDAADLSKIYQDFIDNGGDNTIKGDASMAQAMAGVQESRPDLLPEKDKVALLSNMSADQLLRLDPEAYRDKSVQYALTKHHKYDHESKKQMNFLELLKEDKLGSSVIRDVIKSSTSEGDATDGIITVNPELISDDGLRTLSKEKQTTGTINALAAHDKEKGAALGEGKLDILMQNPQFQIDKLSVEQIKEYAAQIAHNVAPTEVKKMFTDDSKRDQLQAGLQATLAGTMYRKGLSTEDADKVKADLQVTLIGSMQNSGELGQYGGYNTSTKKFTDGNSRQVFANAIEKDSTILRNYTSDIAGGGDITDAAVENADLGMLINSMRKDKNGHSKDNEFRKLLDAIEKQITQKLENASEGEKKELQNKQRIINKALTGWS